MSRLFDALRAHPELALFLAIGLGYLIGRAKIGGFRLGAVIGALLAGVLIGQIGVSVSPELKATFFALFLFSVGYRTGPQFFGGLRSSGLPQAGLTIILCVSALGTAWGVARLFGLDAGTTAGLIAGSLTESATVGTAVDAIGKLGLDTDTTERLNAGVTVAFAVTYLVGLVATVTFLSKVAPKILGTDLAAVCRELEVQMGVRSEGAGTVSAYYDVIMRVYEIPPALAGTTVSALERSFAPERVFVERVRSTGAVVPTRPDLVLAAGDRVTLSGRHHALVELGGALRDREVEDAELLDVPTLALDVVVTNRDLAGQPVQRFARDFSARGVFLRKLVRAGQELPYTLQTVVERGDVVTIVGAANHVEPLAQLIGWAAKPTSETNMVGVGLAIVIGGLFGLPALVIGSLQLHLSVAVGVLVGGLVFGWMSSTSRRFGQIPEPALWLFDSLGLTAFIAAVGLSAGPDFVRGLRDSGGVLVLASVITAIVPQVITLLCGRFVFRMHPGILLGVCCGAATSGPSLAAVQDIAKSRIPTLGYGVSYAVGNVLLALWGGVIVALLGAP